MKLTDEKEGTHRVDGTKEADESEGLTRAKGLMGSIGMAKAKQLTGSMGSTDFGSKLIGEKLFLGRPQLVHVWDKGLSINNKTIKNEKFICSRDRGFVRLLRAGE
jgi:hypothetical protein